MKARGLQHFNYENPPTGHSGDRDAAYSETPKKRISRRAGVILHSYTKSPRFPYLVISIFAFLSLMWTWRILIPHREDVAVSRAVLTPNILRKHCEEHIGPARIEKVSDNVWVALGYDLANTILIKTSDGHVVIDVAMSPKKSREIRKALEEEAGVSHIHSIIYTHSHLDHVGGASAWAENGTDIWGTDALTKHFFKQYGIFRKTEALRGSRQYGALVPISELPCSALGARADLDAVMAEAGFLIPTKTFSGKTSFKVGEEEIHLIEAHGETHDQLFVWLPRNRVLLPGDNYYRAFPNLYTIRGTSPRPVRDWIQSIDEMRRLQPNVLVPSHTGPLVGKDVVAKQLTDYRDGISWVFVSTIKGANKGLNIDELAASVGLPDHLKENDALDELYGQVDWSVRAIYDAELGWFDGEAEDLYPISQEDESERMINLIGGSAKVLKSIEQAQVNGDHKWALHLIKMLRNASARNKSISVKALKVLEAKSLRAIGEGVFNTNGRAYLLQVAQEHLHGPRKEKPPNLSDAFIDSIPISLIFDVLMTRIVPELSIHTHEAAVFLVGNEKYIVTVRRGVAEVIKGEPLFGTPKPIGTVIVSEAIFRRVMLQIISAGTAIMHGDIHIDGDHVAMLNFFQRFEKGA